MSVLLMATIVLVSSSVVQAQPPRYTNCNDIPNVPMNLTQFVLASPLKLLRCSDPSLTCTVGVLTGPGPLGGCGSEYTFFMVQGDNVIYSNSVDPNSPSTGTRTSTCQLGFSNIYKFVPYDLTGPNPYLLAYLCGQESGQVLLVVGYGRDESATGAILDRLVSYYMSNIPGGDSVKNVWCGCPETPFCQGYFN